VHSEFKQNIEQHSNKNRACEFSKLILARVGNVQGGVLCSEVVASSRTSISTSASTSTSTSIATSASTSTSTSTTFDAINQATHLSNF
jgi:hypothetical protein